MIGTFPGKLSFADGDEVDVDLEIAAGQLKLVTGISEIGSWPLEVCSLAPDARDAFNLIVDGDRVRFSPDHPDAFTQFVAQLGSHVLSGGRSNGGSNGGTRSSPGAHEVPAGAESIAAASDEEIALTLEALFASAFTDDDGEAPGPPSAAHHAAQEEASPPAVEPPVPSPTDAADPAPVDDLWEPSHDEAGDDPSGGSGADGAEPAAGPWDGDDDVIATGGWSTGDMEVEEWSPEATAAALEAELARSRPTPEPPAHPSGDSPTAVGGPAGSDDPTDMVDRPAAHWRDYDPPGEETDAPDPTSADLPSTASEWPGEPGPDPVAHDDHFASPPRGYGDDAFDPLAGDPLADEEPWADIPDDVMIPGDPASGDDGDGPDDGASTDRGWFRSTATERLASVADAIKERGEAEEEDPDYSVADEIRASQQKLRSSGRRRDAGRLVKRIGIPLLVVVVLGGLALFTPRVIELLAQRIDAAEEDVPAVDAAVDAAEDPVVDADAEPVDQDPEPGDAAPPEPVPAVETTVPASQTTATTAPPILIFDMPASEFVLRWNDVGTSVSPRFEIPGDLGDDLFAQGLTEYVGIEGRIGEDGTVDGFTVIVDPRGEPQDDQLGIQALGVAIGVVDPSTTGVDRRDLLMELGLDVSEPDLGGIDSEVTRNGVAYRLVFDEESFLLRFTLSPAGTTPPPPQSADQDAEAAEPAG